MTAAAIEICQTYKRYGQLQALNGINLRIEKGEFFGLLGPNGAGKTTLINLLSGLALPDAGQLRIHGYDVVRQYRTSRRMLGVVPQELVFDPFFTVRETLRLQSGFFGLHHNETWINTVMHNLGLTDKADTNMRRLSGGMKRRVLVAQALVHKPPVIVLDEPTAGVDVELRQSLWHFIRQLNRDGHTILLTTHYLEEAEALCTRIAMLKQGRVIALDSTQNLLGALTGCRVRLKLVGKLPASLLPQVIEQTDKDFLLTLPSYSALEPMLKTLRTFGITIQEMTLQQPDLEEVFLRMVRRDMQ
ncbi:ABC transporter ATP-binding protein [Candidatus Nitrotoga fabula]|uniref:Transporter subunit: ATP-binding component of ABC superfamily n=1 Tax=Candidatus Nitrotoga fabula TaxID=2182327 RepID=A0A916BBC4_9PROT|nr:ABC transporter ATP-binding protein [Candidatus Nitrotoga fabula]CAE6693372.1 Putative transporter subunit: ATP-binding component of ABC superfamily [Candidatus Nitrotoga fabula]